MSLKKWSRRLILRPHSCLHLTAETQRRGLLRAKDKSVKIILVFSRAKSMTTALATLLILFALIPGQVGPARGEGRKGSEPTECPGPLYRTQELEYKPRIRSKPDPRYTDKARRSGVSGRVIVRAVLCKTGEVTDVELVEGLPDGLSEAAVKAARRIKFEPGRKDDERVSVKVLVEYYFRVY